MNRRTPALACAAAAILICGSGPAEAASATVTTGHTGSGAPALARVGDRLYVAWTGSTGTAAAKGLNLGYSTAGGKNIVKISNPEKSPQNEGPALVADPDAPGVFMAWPDGRNGNALTLIRYDTSGFSCRTSFTGISTPHSPALAVDSSGKLYAAWTDAAAHVNVALIIPDTCATNATHTMSMLNRSVLAETSPYGPGLIFDSTGRTAMGLMLGWVSDDAARTLNVASWGGSTTLYNRGVIATTAHPSSQPALWIGNDDLYLMFRAPENGADYAYFGFSGGCTPVCGYAGNTGTRVASPIGALGPLYAYFNPAGNLVIDGG